MALKDGFTTGVGHGSGTGRQQAPGQRFFHRVGGRKRYEDHGDPMEVAFTEYVPITDASSVGEARRRGLLLAERLGFDAVRSGEFGAAGHRSLAQRSDPRRRRPDHHGGYAEMGRAPWRRILAMDSGPGIAE